MTSHRTLVLLAHPDLAGSRINARLVDAVRDLEDVTVHDLATEYPDGRIDVAREQQLLLEHDTIVWQFPWHWYSVPAVLKAWMDQVLLYGFAYGAEGTKLRGKTLQVVTTTGGPEDSYSDGGYNRFTMEQLLRPLDATAHLCGMPMAEPMVLHGVRTLSEAELDRLALRYRALLTIDRARAA